MQRKKKNKILLFDLDDTIIVGNANVCISDHNGNVIRSITSSDYSTYRLKNNEKFDFSQFNNLRILNNATLTKYWHILKRAYNNGDNIGILTARGNGEIIKKFLIKNGVNLDEKYIFSVGAECGKYHGNTQERKSEAITEIYGMGFNDITYYDDCEKNLVAVKNMEQKLDDLTVHAIKAKVN